MEIQENLPCFTNEKPNKLSDLPKVSTQPLKWQMRDGRKFTPTMANESLGSQQQRLPKSFRETLRGRGSRARCFHTHTLGNSPASLTERSPGSARAKEGTTLLNQRPRWSQAGSRQAQKEEDGQTVGRGLRLGVPEPFTVPASVSAEPAPARPPQRTLSPTRLQRLSTPTSELLSLARFAPSIAGHTPTGAAQSHPEAADSAGAGSDAHLPASPMAASVRTSRGCSQSPTPLPRNTNPRRPRPSAAPPRRPIAKMRWHHVQERRSVPTLQRGM